MEDEEPQVRARKGRSRTDESRRLEERESQLRQGFQMKWQDPFYIPPEKIPAGWHYRWVRTSVLGDTSFSKLQEAARLGFTPVPSDRHPDLVFKSPVDRENSLDGFIHNGGLMLHEIPLSIMKDRKYQEDVKNAELLQSMPGLHNSMNEFNIPVKVMSNLAPHYSNSERGFA